MESICEIEAENIVAWYFFHKKRLPSERKNELVIRVEIKFTYGSRKTHFVAIFISNKFWDIFSCISEKISDEFDYSYDLKINFDFFSISVPITWVAILKLIKNIQNERFCSKNKKKGEKFEFAAISVVLELWDPFFRIPEKIFDKFNYSHNLIKMSISLWFQRHQSMACPTRIRCNCKNCFWDLILSEHGLASSQTDKKFF